MEPKAPRWAWVLATGLGSGLMRPAPGTWGSLVGLVVWCLLSRILLSPFFMWASVHQASISLTCSILVVEALIILFIVVMIRLAVLASDLLVMETGEKDPHYIVIDEWVGMWIALWPVRWEIAQCYNYISTAEFRQWLPIFVIPFLAFRFLDIWKPWPIRQIQVLSGGYGIVADDVVAGLFSIPIVILLTTLTMRTIN